MPPEVAALLLPTGQAIAPNGGVELAQLLVPFGGGQGGEKHRGTSCFKGVTKEPMCSFRAPELGANLRSRQPGHWRRRRGLEAELEGSQVIIPFGVAQKKPQENPSFWAFLYCVVCLVFFLLSLETTTEMLARPILGELRQGGKMFGARL